MISRRVLIVGLSTAGFATAATARTPKPSTVKVKIAGGTGMNPGPGGGDRPLTVFICKLRGTSKFDRADYFALQSDLDATLAGDLIGSEIMTVLPGRLGTLDLNVEPEAAAIGFAAMVRNPTGRRWRATTAVSPGSQFTLNVSVGRAGLATRKVINNPVMDFLNGGN